MSDETCKWCRAGRVIDGRCERCGESLRDPTETAMTAMPCPIRDLPDANPSVVAGMSWMRDSLRRPHSAISTQTVTVKVFEMTDGSRCYHIAAPSQEEALMLAEFGHDRIVKRTDGHVESMAPHCSREIPHAIVFHRMDGLRDEARRDEDDCRKIASELYDKRRACIEAQQRVPLDHEAWQRMIPLGWGEPPPKWIDLGDLIRKDPWTPPQIYAMLGE